jgi:hypothetical protein
MMDDGRKRCPPMDFELAILTVAVSAAILTASKTLFHY